MDSNPEGYLSDSEFESVIRSAPLVSIDLIARLKDGRILLGRRKNEPARGKFFVVGGRIRKKESIEAAFRRITLSELGVERKLSDASFIGAYTHSYDTNVFQKPGLGTHYVVLAYEIVLDEKPKLPKEQHDEYDWRSEEQILTSADAHENTKAYFREVAMRSESQYTALAARRNTLNTMLWQTPALSLSALAFLLNVAGNKNAYREVRMVTCALALIVALFTLQLFIRHRKLEVRDSKLLEEFEKKNRHLGYASVNSRFRESEFLICRLLNPFEWPAYVLWFCLFLMFAGASIWLWDLNYKNSWQYVPEIGISTASNSPPPVSQTVSAITGSDMTNNAALPK